MRNIGLSGGTLQALGFRHKLRLREGVKVLDIELGMLSETVESQQGGRKEKKRMR